MKTQVACQYAIVRFTPYAETGEFANVGVVLACPEINYLQGQLAPHKRTQRITDFFQGLEARIYREAMKYVTAEIQRVADAVRRDQIPASYAFDSITRPREALVTFSQTRVIMSASPEVAIKQLYDRFIDRDFATKEYHEQILTKGVSKILSTAKLKSYFDDRAVGDDTFNVKFPFVSTNPDAPQVVIKPLFLGHDEPNKIFEHGGAWVQRVARLKKHHTMPRHTLFAVNEPHSNAGTPTAKRLKAAHEIIKELRDLDAQVIMSDDRDALLSFAELAKPTY